MSHGADPWSSLNANSAGAVMPSALSCGYSYLWRSPSGNLARAVRTGPGGTRLSAGTSSLVLRSFTGRTRQPVRGLRFCRWSALRVHPQSHEFGPALGPVTENAVSSAAGGPTMPGPAVPPTSAPCWILRHVPEGRFGTNGISRSCDRMEGDDRRGRRQLGHQQPCPRIGRSVP